MKRCLTALISLSCILCLFGCFNGGNVSDNNNDVGNNIGDIKNNYTYEELVEAFSDDGVRPIHLNAQQITKMKANISELIELDGDVLKVCQIQKNGVFVYVIEFDNDNDAIKLCEERGSNGMYTRREKNIAVYGNNEAIKSLK